MKHEDIIIENDGKSARSISQKYYQNNFVVCEPLIPKKGSYSFSFKIGGWVMIGVCDIEKIKQQKFIVTLDEIPQIHCYMIENDGTSYSSFENQEKRQKSFTYSEYDIIQVLIDFELKIIKWIKPQTKESFQMKINPSTSNLFPCLALGQAWVEVINQ
ncbi:unnamed protein product [Paramecium sonneborni]|nr:unnamed protein product [Paramecium sonneborni]